MILSAIINFILSLVNGVLGILPNASDIPSGITSSLSTLGSTLNYVNLILPVDTLMALLTFAVVFKLATFTWRIIASLAHFVRGAPIHSRG